MNLRRSVFEFIPQADVEMPYLSLEEASTNISSNGIVYDFTLRDQVNDKSLSTTLTVEELFMLRSYIDYLLQLRKEDPTRQEC